MSTYLKATRAGFETRGIKITQIGVNQILVKIGSDGFVACGRMGHYRTYHNKCIYDIDLLIDRAEISVRF